MTARSPRNGRGAKALSLPVVLTTTPRTWLRLLRDYRVDPRYRARAALWLGVSCLLEPLRRHERLRHGEATRRAPIERAPIFVIGYGRSGTTHLHNLLAQDPQLGWVSNLHALAPSFFLSSRRLLAPLLSRVMPSERPMDRMRVSAESPQEEEVAVANLLHLASIHGLVFPRDFGRIYERCVFWTGGDAERRAWVEAYLEVLGQATLAHGGKRLVLKSPTNTGRIRPLLELFPDARFVHICRDPYEVLPSLRHMFRTLVPAHQLQDVGAEELDDILMDNYEIAVRSYLEARGEIPAGQLAEVRFEALEADPIGVLRSIYETLGLDGFEEALPCFVSYLESVRGYEKNGLAATDEVVERVNTRWRFALEAFGYPVRSAAGVP